MINLMADCVFCKIVRDELPAQMVYSGDKAVAIMSIQPIRTGHVLVIPKNHEPEFYKLDGDTYTELMGVVKKLSPVINKLYKPKKVGLLVAGWDVSHAHIHIVPMHASDDLISKREIDNSIEISTQEKLAVEKDKIVQELPK